MPRRRKCRWVGFQPRITYFKPIGIENKEEIILTLDELEAIRLVDLLDKSQEEAAREMNISQPTLHRLLKSARKKVSESIIKGKVIKIGGGNIMVREKRGRGFGFEGPAESCICPNCGYKEEKVRGVPCSSLKCPKCGTRMVRG